MIKKFGDFAVLPQSELVHIGFLNNRCGYFGTVASLTPKLCSTNLKPAGFTTISYNDRTLLSISFVWNGVTEEELAAALLA